MGTDESIAQLQREVAALHAALVTHAGALSAHRVLLEHMLDAALALSPDVFAAVMGGALTTMRAPPARTGEPADPNAAEIQVHAMTHLQRMGDEVARHRPQAGAQE